MLSRRIQISNHTQKLFGIHLKREHRLRFAMRTLHSGFADKPIHPLQASRQMRPAPAARASVAVDVVRF